MRNGLGSDQVLLFIIDKKLKIFGHVSCFFFGNHCTIKFVKKSKQKKEKARLVSLGLGLRESCLLI